MISLFLFILIFCHSWASKISHVSCKVSTSGFSYQNKLFTDSSKRLHANWLSQLALYAADVFEKFYFCKISCLLLAFENFAKFTGKLENILENS